VWISWPADGNGSQYALSVVNFGPQQRKNWTVELKSSIGEPEWRFYKEAYNQRKNLWTVRTGDLELILGLVTSDPAGHQPEQANRFVLSTPSSSALFDDNRESGKGKESPSQWNTGPLTPLPQQSPKNQGGDRAQEMAAALLLSGNLKEVDLPSIMQSINLCKMTGKLNLSQSATQVEVYFNNGDLIHAEACHTIMEGGTDKGDGVILDLFTWDEGTFQFQQGWKTSERSIKRKLHSLLLEGATLRDYQEALTKQNLSTTSVLCRHPSTAQITEEEFDQRINEGLSLHMELQKRIFLSLREPAPLEHILARISTPRSVWVPAIFNLINLGLITVSGGAADDREDTAMFVGIEKQIEGARKALLQPDSGMYSYPYFLLAASEEFARNKNGGQPFCVVMLDFSAPHLVSDDAMAVINACFDKVKRSYDILSFCLPSFLFILLPQTNTRMAKDIMQRFLLDLSKAKLDVLTEGSALGTRGGITSVPRDGIELVQILACANRFRRLATEETPLITADKQQQ
jgi:hypothetical protein